MLKWLRIGLEIERSADAALLWAALMLGFFFLLRASEYLDVGRPLTNRGLCCRHVVLKIKGETCTRHNFMQADEVAICIQGSKTDIFNRGEYRNHFEHIPSDDSTRLCVVEAVKVYVKHFPDKMFNQGEAHGPFLTDSHDTHLNRNTLQAVLHKAAEGTGCPAGSFGSHSLRFGGASALWAAFHDTGLVRRWGRWASDSFHTYIWEDRKGSSGIATAIAESDITPA